jgi:hypothetical protein
MTLNLTFLKNTYCFFRILHMNYYKEIILINYLIFNLFSAATHGFSFFGTFLSTFRFAHSFFHGSFYTFVFTHGFGFFSVSFGTFFSTFGWFGGGKVSGHYILYEENNFTKIQKIQKIQKKYKKYKK